jgi:hypothetical protein
MNYAVTSGLLVAGVVITAGLFLLSKLAIKEKSLLLLVSLFCIATGFLLLLLDVVLIGASTGPASIIEYLLFKKSAGDYGIAGRWIFTSYFFFISGILMTLYHYIFTRRKKDNDE